MSGPDFLCIGMPKAGTDWLYDQLDVHPEFWMPPLKELHYFDYAQPASLYERGHASQKVWKRLHRAAHDRDAFGRELENRRGREFNHRDDAFLDKVEILLRRGFEVEDYKALFEVKGPLRSGDITPAYCTLDSRNIEFISANLASGLKVILLIRNPVERLWSQLCMHIRRRPEKESILENFGEFEAYVRKPGVQARSFASRTYERWAGHFPDNRIWVGLLDGLRENPANFRGAAIRFLGAEPSAYQGPRQAGFNRKASQKKVEMPPRHADFLREYFDEEIRRSARLFGSYARRW